MSDQRTRPGPTGETRRWPTWVERMTDFAVLPDDRTELIKTKRLFTVAMWASLPTSCLSVYQLYVSGAPWAALSVCIPIVTGVIALASMWLRPSTYPAVMHVVAFGTIATTVTMIIILGGVIEAAGNTSWGTLVVIGAVAIFADRRAHLWLAIFAVSTVGAFLVAQQVEPLYVLPNSSYFAVFNVLIITVFIYAMLYYFVRQSARLYRETETLLLNILPDQIAERLKRSDDMIADGYDSASILFADVAGFTPMAARMTPDGVINLLNEVFTDFDDLVAERGLEKIKTIGDAYMVAGGVPVEREDHARAICDLAIAMRDLVLSQRFADHTLSMRIGIASGPVMAGIIGSQKFSYDLWGDTVNLASRMESTGTVGHIQMTPETRELVAPYFDCERRGVVDVKGKGPVETWYLVGHREA